MSHRYFFDHNLSPKIADALNALGFQVVALMRHFPTDTPDEEWLEKVRDAIVVTCDRRIQGIDVFRALMDQKARTVIFLERGWTKLQLREQAWKLIKAWWDVDAEVQPSHAYSLSVGGRLTRLP